METYVIGSWAEGSRWRRSEDRNPYDVAPPRRRTRADPGAEPRPPLARQTPRRGVQQGIHVGRFDDRVFADVLRDVEKRIGESGVHNPIGAVSDGRTKWFRLTETSQARTGDLPESLRSCKP